MSNMQAAIKSGFDLLGDLVKRAFQYLASEPVQFLKFIIPILLIFSFITVLHGWFSIMGSEGVRAPVREILTVPLILFGVSAILGVMVFAEKGPSMFLSVFIIGTVVAGTDVAEIGGKLATDIFSNTAAIYQGGGGIGAQSQEYVSGAGGIKLETQPSEAVTNAAPAIETPMERVEAEPGNESATDASAAENPN